MATFGPKGSDRPLAPTFTLKNYVQFFAAGGLCATLTHGGLTPIDVVKTRLQLEPKGSKYTMTSMARKIVQTEGPGGLLTGFAPTAVGYLIQGGAKFCGYEFFKRNAVEAIGDPAKVRKYRQLIYLGSASAAEVIATTLLTPLEAARIRLVSQPTYAKGLGSAITRMAKEQGLPGFYAGYIPILFKQVPYAIGQFYTNEMAHSWVNSVFPKSQQAKWGKPGEIGIQLGCGIVAGVAAAVLSHVRRAALQHHSPAARRHASVEDQQGRRRQGLGADEACPCRRSDRLRRHLGRSHDAYPDDGNPRERPVPRVRPVQAAPRCVVVGSVTDPQVLRPASRFHRSSGRGS